MDWIISGWSALGIVAAKAIGMSIVAVFLLRLGERRTLAQWTIVDFVTAVALGAVIGRTAIASTQSFAAGAVALLSLIVTHQVISKLRLIPRVRLALDPKPVVLVRDGQLQEAQLRRCALPREDLFAQLRQQGIFDTSELKFLIYETGGTLTPVRQKNASSPLVQDALPAAD